jgi:hypothetical protein
VKAAYPAKYVAPKAAPASPVYYSAPKSAPVAIDTPIYYESGTPMAPKAPKGGPIMPVSGIRSGSDSPFYP